MSSGSGLQDPGFKQQVVPVKKAVPLPVEIAKDIERITEEGLLVYSDNPSYSKAFDEFSNKVSSSDSESEQVADDQSELGSDVQADQDDFSNGNRAKVKRVASKDVLTDKDFILKTEGPLARLNQKRKRGPLNFKSNLAGSGLPELTGGKTVNYIVRLGDTLMKIAFEKYGQYLRWKDIYKINQNKMQSPERMQVGTELTIKNVKYIYIQRDGKPYLIRKMDTLKSISQKLYGTPDRWEDIWKNNPQLIRNPKKIYAGFTLYYPNDTKTKPALEVREPSAAENAKEENNNINLPKTLPNKLPNK